MVRLFTLVAVLLGLLVPVIESAHAVAVVAPETLVVNPCGDSGLPCHAGGATGNADAYVRNVVFGGTQNIFNAFYGVLFAMMVVYGFKLVVSSRNDSAISEAMTAYAQAFAGAVLVTGASIIASSFTNTATVVNTTPIETGVVDNVIDFFFGIVGVCLSLNIVIQGVRLIVAINEGNVDTARRNLIQSAVGGVAVMIAGAVFDFIRPGTPNPIGEQVVGISNFLATLFGTLAVMGFIVAGLMLVISVDEGLKDKARRLMIGSALAVAIVVMANGIIAVML